MYRIAFTVSTAQLPVIISALSNEVKDLVINEIKPPETHIEPYKPNGLGLTQTERSQIWNAIEARIPKNKVFFTRDIKPLIEQSGFSSQSTSYFTTIAVQEGFLQRLGRGSFRRIR